jgi:hypothetical protein
VHEVALTFRGGSSDRGISEIRPREQLRGPEQT